MIKLTPIGKVISARKEPRDDNWGNVTSVIELDNPFTGEALDHIEDFSHAEILFYFHLVDTDKVETGSRHPRNNQTWPRVGIFAQRGKNRPNRLGATIVKILKHQGIRLYVQGLDAIDGTPVLDIKPVMKEFLPMEEPSQPEWATELMRNYW